MIENSNTTRFQYEHSIVRVAIRGISTVLFLVLMGVSTWAHPAEAPAKKAEPAKAPDGEDAPKPKEPPAPKRLKPLTTKDGWQIHCMYYGPQEGIRDGKETVPIILIHGWGGQGSDYSFLAHGLQTYGHAVIVPDLRGHGRSTTRNLPNGNVAVVKHNDARQFTPVDRKNIFRDIDEVFSALKNDYDANGEVNIDLLCVIGAEAGSIVALNWAAQDWSWPATTKGRQGQFVKGLVLLSPRQSMERLNATDALSHPAIQKNVSIMIAVGENDRKSYSEASRMHSRLKKIRPEPPKDPNERLRKQDLFFVTAGTNLQGTGLLQKALEKEVSYKIAVFIQLRAVRRKGDFPWRGWMAKD